MTDAELKTFYKNWIKDYCNNDFLDDEGNENLPAGVELVLDKLVDFHKQDLNVASEKIADLSVSYFQDQIPTRIKQMLDPYKKMKW